MMWSAPGDFNGRGHRVGFLLCLLLFLCQALRVADCDGWKHNGTGEEWEGKSPTTPLGNPPRGDPQSYPWHPDGSGPGGLRPEGGENDCVHGLEEGDDAEGRTGVICRVKGGGGRQEFAESEDTEYSPANPPLPAVDWPKANFSRADRSKGEVRGTSRNVSFTNGQYGGASERGGIIHKGDTGVGSFLKEQPLAGSRKRPNHEAPDSEVTVSNMSAAAERSAENKRSQQNGADSPSSSDDAILFPDELEQYDDEESGDGSPVHTYFFIRTPLRNRTKNKCGPNQRFFRGRCRTYVP